MNARIQTLLVAAVLFALPTCLSAQVGVGTNALQTAVKDAGGGQFRYSYTLVHRGKPREVWSEILLDLAAPRRGKPQAKAGTGVLLLDGTLNSDSFPSHPPVTIDSPPLWLAAVYYTGSISWGADARGGVTYGLRPGKAQGGFALTSPALPAYRQYQIVPFYEFAGVSGDHAADVDSAIVLYRGWTAAPGVMAADVDGQYLRNQVEGACWYRAATCVRLRAWAYSAWTAESDKNRAELIRSLGQLALLAQQDATLGSWGQRVITSAVNAYYARLKAVR